MVVDHVIDTMIHLFRDKFHCYTFALYIPIEMKKEMSYRSHIWRLNFVTFEIVSTRKGVSMYTSPYIIFYTVFTWCTWF